MSESIFDKFTNLYSLEKTLRFELKPVFQTEEKIKEKGFLKSDKDKSDYCKVLKRILDDYHKYFIDVCLSKADNADLNWNELSELLKEYERCNKKEKLDISKNLEDEKKKCREKISNLFINSPEYENLVNKTTKKLFSPLQRGKDSEASNGKGNEAEDESKLLCFCDWLSQNDQYKKEKKEIENAIKLFSNFNSYFENYQESRKNIYSSKPIPTAVPYRIVNDNFPKFLQNIFIFKTIQEKCSQVIFDVEKELSSYLGKEKLDDIFALESFNKYLGQGGKENQRGIDFYNQIIGGIAEKEGGINLRGINQFLNLYWQQNPEFAKENRRIKMVPLYKQILSDRSSLSFKIESIENDKELKTALLECADKLEEKNDEKKSVFEDTRDLFESLKNQNLQEIYINRKDINAVSRILTGDWSWLQARMNVYADEKFTTKAEKARWQKSLDDEGENKSKGFYSLAELNGVLEYSSDIVVETDIRITDYFEHRCKFYIEKESKRFIQGSELVALSVKELCDDIQIKRKRMDRVLENLSDEKLLKEKPEDVAVIKDYLDAVQDLLHRIKPLKVNCAGDFSFYSIYDPIYSALSEVIFVYNKTRNYITKKAGSPEKYKLNFDNPTLANGWDLNKEQAYASVLLRKNGMYYLGIMNPKNKPKFAEEYKVVDGQACYEKMIYKLLPTPNKMLPKVFFSVKGKGTFNPPENILKGYEQKKYIKGKNFDINFCYELIDWFKSDINQHEDWKKFGFKFSDTKSYKDISDFYREVTNQGYKLTFINIPESEIKKIVSEGKLYLFQIYNKDFAPGANGMLNMHTLYWKNLFSEDNLKNVCLKLNGTNVELFYRPAGIKETTVHAKGSYLLNKTTKDGESIPEKIYLEIYKHANGKLEKLSDEAKTYKENHKIVLKKASHEIIKDRHYTEAKFLFHVPLTINFNASENSSSINENVCGFLKNNPDVNIIGLDRGERHLIYLSLINQKGEIIRQFSFNEVERNKDEKIKVNYHEKLDQREKERYAARKSWQTVEKIAELKEGYLSAVIHQLTKLMVEYNAIIVMENLNTGFKRGRFHIEKQVYQKFESMLINKLNYLVFKDKNEKEPGGVLNGLQLTDKFKSFDKLGNQSGMLFYVPAGYTSKIDPKTGFVNLFEFSKLINVIAKREFFDKFERIYFDQQNESFVFEFRYKNFDGIAKQDESGRLWAAYSKGERIVYNKNEHKCKKISPTEELKKLFNANKIEYSAGSDIKRSIMEIGEELKPGERPSSEVAAFWDNFLRNFKYILQMRNSNNETGEDYIVSPVMDKEGEFFDSREERKKGDSAGLPIDADANGAYHIALKGLLLIKRLNSMQTKDNKVNPISNAEWFKFVQNKE